MLRPLVLLFTVLPASRVRYHAPLSSPGIDYRESMIHPSERCVACHVPNRRNDHHAAKPSEHMQQTQQPPDRRCNLPTTPKLACAAEGWEDHKGRRLRVNYEPKIPCTVYDPPRVVWMPDDRLAHILLSSHYRVPSASRTFPFYHVDGREMKVSPHTGDYDNLHGTMAYLIGLCF